MINRRIFLLECKRKGLKPDHITNSAKNLFNLLDNGPRKLSNKISNFNNRLIFQIINFEITYTNSKIKVITNLMSKIEENLLVNLPVNILNNFKAKQLVNFNRIFHNIKLRIIS